MFFTEAWGWSPHSDGSLAHTGFTAFEPHIQLESNVRAHVMQQRRVIVSKLVFIQMTESLKKSTKEEPESYMTACLSQRENPGKHFLSDSTNWRYWLLSLEKKHEGSSRRHLTERNQIISIKSDFWNAAAQLEDHRYESRPSVAFPCTGSFHSPKTCMQVH